MSLTLLGRLDQLHKLSRECKELRITGFQSPAEDEKEKSLSFDLIVGLGKPQIWVFKVDDDSLIRFGLFPGDRIAVDRSIDCQPDCLAVVHVDGDSQYRLRLLTKDDNGDRLLKAPDTDVSPLNMHSGTQVEVWGKAKWVLSQLGW
ncbi:MAG: RulA protein [Pseudomonas sp. PGPPP3]|nr:MAG: RulA protein [Pseudomonas sp. PGPPP3]